MKWIVAIIMMLVSSVASAQITVPPSVGAQSSNGVVTLPLSVTANDMLLLLCAYDSTGSAPSNGPSACTGTSCATGGWTQLAACSTTNAISDVEYKTATAVDVSNAGSGTYTFTATMLKEDCRLVDYRNPLTTGPIEVSKGCNVPANGTTLTWNSITTTVNNDLILHLSAYGDSPPATGPAGDTSRFNDGGSGNNWGLYLGDVAQVTAGAGVGSASGTTVHNAFSANQTIALIPATQPTTATTGLIAYTYGNNLYVVPAAGGAGGPKQLTSLGEDGQPNWSHNGQIIAFHRKGADSSDSIWRINVDGTGLTQVSPAGNINVGSLPIKGDLNPDFTPDDSKIIYNHTTITQTSPTVISHSGVYTMTTSGANVTTIIDDGAHAFIEPHVSQDNVQVLMDSDNFTSGRPQIVKCNLANCAVTLCQLTNANPSAGSPFWSPDGGRFTFISTNASINNNVQISSENQDGTGLRQLTSFTGLKPDPDVPAYKWYDNSKLMFLGTDCTPAGANGCSGNGTSYPATIYTMNLDGTNLTNTGISVDSSGGEPRFQPAPTNGNSPPTYMGGIL